jgi:Zinc-finger of C2H2 type/Zinc finger, C2H2 type
VHIKFHFTKRKNRFMCHLCGRAFLQNGSLKLHLKEHKAIEEGSFNYFCEECGKGYVKYWSYFQHKRAHKKRELDGKLTPNSQYCYSCKENFPSHKDYIKHLEDKHSLPVETDKINAENSQKIAEAEDQRKRRTRATAEEQENFAFTCDICQKKCSTKGNLKMHQEYHTKNYKFFCEHEGCDKKFIRIREFKIHRQSHLGITYHCPVCPKVS